MTANSQPAQQSPAARAHRHWRAEAVADPGGQEAEGPTATLATDHLELVRLMSSLRRQVTEVAGAHPLQVPQQRMLSLFGAPPVGPSVQGAPLLGMSLAEPPGRLPEPSLGIQQSPPRLARLSSIAPALIPPQVPEEAPATTDPHALLIQADTGPLTAPCARPGRRRRPHNRSRYGPSSIIDLCWCARRRC